jgi:hypothetical protein
VLSLGGLVGEFLKDFSGDQVIAWGLGGMDILFYGILDLVNPDLFHW